MSMGTVCGETRRTPFSFSTSYWSSRVVTPPMPEAMTAPSRSGSTVGVLAGRGGVTGVRPRLAGRDQRELRRAVQLAGQRAGQDLARVHGDRRGDTDRQFGEPLAAPGA